MPLPDDNPVWPPSHVAAANELYERYGAWYSGDPDLLSAAYASTLGTGGSLDAKQYVRPGQGGSALLGLATRTFWGAPPPGGSLKLAKLHVPLPSDIAMTSSDLLFGEPPAFTVPDEDEATQARLDELLTDGGAYAVLLEAAELAAAYGGVYLRVTWDPEVADYPLLDAIPPDAAVPEFRSGRLVAVTFWRTLGRDAGKVLRHLERHEPGRVWHGLYLGTDERLGRRIDLAEHPETEPFAALVGGDGYIETGADGLAVEYVPNMRPNRHLRGSQLGRSDFAGIEPLFDGLDEVWSSWMRDIRLGKGRVIVPDVYLSNQGRGKGSTWDAEQEIYQAVAAMPGADAGLAIQVVQFQIRTADHRDTASEITTQALRGAGYSVQTFGESGDVAATATEVVARQQRTMQTRMRKIGYFRPSLRRLTLAWLQIDVARFKPAGVTPCVPDLEWPDAVSDGPEALARTIQMYRAADVISRQTANEMMHPDWDGDVIDDEVARIERESGLAEVPDPGGPDTPAPAGARTPFAARRERVPAGR